MFGLITKESRMSTEVVNAAQDQRYVNVEVILDFKPEDFHMGSLQQIGILSGVEGTKVRLRRVPVHRLSELAQYYWIRRVEPLRM